MARNRVAQVQPTGRRTPTLPPRSLTRSALGWIVRAAGYVRAGLDRRAVIVGFHRVNDATAGDALTRGTRDYERFCRFFRSHFDVVPLRDILGRLETGQTLEGLLAITHDDGYRDNLEHAAPILAKLGLPATFFVSTGFIGSNVVAPWDRGLPEAPGWMTWDQVRELRALGFDIGAHTCTHADLGVLGAEEALAELVDSRRKLEHELGEPIDLFAYPFGGDANMTPQNRALVRQAGYRCCLSCRGGLARDGADPFELPRVPISPWYADPSQLAFDLARGSA
jgi:peptidoglycan/xylan/chitin deacetylase (PgdA/CDA1 family)